MKELDEKIAKLVAAQNEAKKKSEEEIERARKSQDERNKLQQSAQQILSEEIYPRLSQIAEKIKSAGGEAHCEKIAGSPPGTSIVSINFFKQGKPGSFASDGKSISISYRESDKSFIFVTQSKSEPPRLLISEYNVEKFQGIIADLMPS